MSRTPEANRQTLAWIAACLAVQFAFGVHTACVHTPTHDEFWHLPVGLHILRSGRCDIEPLNPPLTRVVTALPAWICRVDPGRLPEESANPSEYGLAFLERNSASWMTWYIAGRIMNLLWLCAGGCFVAAWAWRLFGGNAALLATIAWSTEPNLLAHGSLITPDVGMTCLWAATLSLAHRYTQTPSSRVAAWTGLALGLALLSKYTAVLLFPVLGVAAIGWYVLERSPSRPHWTRALKDTAIAALVTGVVWNGGYLFRGTFATWGDAPAKSQAMQRLLANWPVLRSIPSPIPIGALHGLDSQSMAVESQHPTYLDGDWSQSGFPAYFLWAILYKLPLLWLVGGALTAVCWTRPARRESFSRWLWLVWPGGLLLAVASTTPMQLGIRYVLPLLPCAAVLGSRWGDAVLVFRNLPQRIALVFVLIGACIGLREHPHHLTYFQEVAGDVTETGLPRLLDSNWDWGQDLHQAAVELKKLGWDSKPVYLAYFGTVPPSAVGLTQYELPLHGAIVPGRYVCSVNFVFGRPNAVTAADGSQHQLSLYQLGFLQFVTPTVTAGRSIWLCEVTADDVLRIQALSRQLHP